MTALNLSTDRIVSCSRCAAELGKIRDGSFVLRPRTRITVDQDGQPMCLQHRLTTTIGPGR